MRLDAEFAEHAGRKLIIQGREHAATEEQLAEHDAALAWMAARVSRT
jgi:hypothetical protein